MVLCWELSPAFEVVALTPFFFFASPPRSYLLQRYPIPSPRSWISTDAFQPKTSAVYFGLPSPCISWRYAARSAFYSSETVGFERKKEVDCI